MNERPRALLIVGSLKRPRSTSEVLGTHLLSRLGEQGWASETIHLKPSLRLERARDELLSAVQRADLLVFAFPLYVDSLPTLVINASELIAAQRRATANPRQQQLVAIVNCGFPEAQHCATAVAICRRFAAVTGITWAGGLALGGGEVINGGTLTGKGGMLRNVARALDIAAAALAARQPVPQEAVDLMARPLMPAWIYTTVGTLRWRQWAWKYKAKVSLSYRPYEE